MIHGKLGVVCLAVVVIFLSANTSLAEEGKFSIGVFGGWDWGIEDEAVEGFSETEFEDGSVIGGSVMYWFPNRFALEMVVEDYSLDLEERGDMIGTLNLTPLLLLLKYQEMPSGEQGFAPHIDIGGGISFNSFDEGTVINDLEDWFGIEYTVDTDDSFVFEFGVGMDYFFSRRFSMSVDARYLFTDVDTSREVLDPGGTVIIDDADTFQASTVQLLFGLRAWF